MIRHSPTEGSLALKQRVIVINPSERNDAKRLRVAAYIRVSSDSSDQLNSFIAQANHYTEKIQSHEDWKMVDLYADEGISGTSAEKRPEFQRLLSDCRKGKIDRILVKSISRFARNTKDCLETIRSLKLIGVSVCFEEQNIDTANMGGELLTSVFAAIAQKESESISQNMRWSYQYRMKSGTYLPAAMPFGYVVKNGEVVPDERKASIVQWIFQEYLRGQNMSEIAEELNRKEIPLRREDMGKRWRRSAISYILSNERYTGNSRWQKTYMTDTMPARHVLNHGERDQYYAENTHPALIEQSIFDAVQMQKKLRGDIRSQQSKKESPLHLKIYCGNCGSVFKRKYRGEKLYWVCRQHDESAESCGLKQIAEFEIKEAFQRLCFNLKTNPDILSQLLSDLRKIREKKLLWDIEIIKLNKRISDINHQNQMLAEMNQAGLVDSDIFLSQSRKVAHQLKECKEKKEQILEQNSDNKIDRTQDLIEWFELLPEPKFEFDDEDFLDVVERIIVRKETIIFCLLNGLKLGEKRK